HTHSAPALKGVAPNIFGATLPAEQQQKIDNYTKELTDRLEQVSLAALADRRPANLAWAIGKTDFAANRRTRLGPVDHRMPMLRATDASGRLRAVIVGYACHCTTLDPNDNLIAGDWAGDAQVEIEKDHPSAIAMVVIGCGADANPRDRLSRAASLRHGRAIADEVKRLLALPLRPLKTAPIGKLVRIPLKFDTLPTRDELDQLVKAGGAAGHLAQLELEALDRGESLPKSIDYPIQSWQFGDDLVMVFMAGEVVVDYALRVYKEFDSSRLWVVAYANEAPCYIPSERILYEGGYEARDAMVYYGLPTRLRPGLEDQIDAAVRSLVPVSFAARPGQAPGSEAPKPANEAKPPAAAARAGMPPPLGPAEALRSIRVPQGLTVELVAAEPLVLDPVAIDFGSDGKLWVCEMRDYPTGMDGHWKPGGQIRFLEDTNSDGIYDRATVLLDGIPFPTWVMAWRKGVLVCAAPDILYAEDTDGDGKADVRQVLFHGFATENYQARVNGLYYGLDNWVYGANGLIGGAIRGTATGKEVIIGGRDFRIRPDSGAMEPASGLTQQGRARDDWDNHFGGNNSVLLQHYPFPDSYARRNRRVAAPRPAVYVPAGDESARVYPASHTLERYNHPESADRVTSACSPSIYRDTLLGPAYAGNAFICEPVHNLVHREVLTPDGITFTSLRASSEQTSEFLASTDNWFRPVQVRTGPDGALYIVDMYRFVIELPRWISPEVLATLDVRAGEDKGRIYRVLPAGAKARPVPNLDRLATPALARALETENGILRETVQRLLVHRADRGAVPVLARLARSSAMPACRMQALWTLEGLGALEPAQVRAALKDAHAGVRRQAIRMAEAMLGSDAEMGPALEALVSDSDVGVRYQLALSLGEWDDPRAGAALGRLAVRDASDPWVRAAVLSAAGRDPSAVLSAVLGAQLEGDDRSALVEPLIATLAGVGTPESLARALDACTEPERGSVRPWRLSALGALLASADRP
ncbi:MAG TPA: PVC-type heme-binding CxxCH protein, partial [Isosphaeraceae bacterium]|nr:PVC-type heme-binding CxxCH protein [Isosphaeraceae bacterium]